MRVIGELRDVRLGISGGTCERMAFDLQAALELLGMQTEKTA